MGRTVGVSITHENRVLLYLDRCSQYKEEYVVPRCVAQDGISQILDLRQQQVSRALVALIRSERAYKRMAYVPEGNRRRQVYFLTDKGENDARNLTEKLRSRKILVRLDSQELKEYSLGDACRLVNPSLSVLEVSDSIGDDGIFDVGHLVRYDISREGTVQRSTRDRATSKRTAGPKREEPRGFHFSSSVPVVQNFVGRDDELHRLINGIKDSKVKAVVVIGIPGIGKTTLIAKSLGTLRKKRDVFWYGFDHWSDLRGLMAWFNESLSTMEGSEPAVRSMPENYEDVSRVLRSLGKRLVNKKAVFVLDDLHMADEKCILFIKSVFSMIKKMDNVSLVIGSRKKVPFYNANDRVVQKTVTELNLSGLDRDSSMSLLTKRGFDPPQADSAYNFSKGHPLALQIMKSSSQSSIKGDFWQFVMQEIIGELDETEKSMLTAAAIHRMPVGPEAILKVKGSSPESLAGLTGRSLIKDVEGGRLLVHDLLKDFLMEWQGDDDKRTNHGVAAGYYDELIQGNTLEGPDRAIAALESVHHWMESGEQETAVIRLVDNGSLILDISNRAVLELLDGFDVDDLSPNLKGELGNLRGDVSLRMGDWDSAMKEYERNIRLSKKAMASKENQHLMASTYEKMGAAYRQVGDWKSTIDYLKRSIKLQKEQGERHDLVRTLNDLGNALLMSGDPDGAEDAFNEALTTLRKHPDGLGETLTRRNLALLYSDTGRPDDSAGELKRAEELAQREGYVEAEIQVQLTRAEIFIRQNELSKAYAEFHKVDDLVQDDGVPLSYRAVEMQVRIAQGYLDTRRNAAARKSYDRALDMIDRLSLRGQENRTSSFNPLGLFQRRDPSRTGTAGVKDYQGLSVSLRTRLVDILLNMIELGNVKERPKLHKKLLSAAESGEVESPVIMKTVELANRLQETGDLKVSSSLLGAAREMLIGKGDNAGLAVVHYNMGGLANVQGKRSQAVKEFERSAKYAKAAGNKQGVLRAKKAMKGK